MVLLRLINKINSRITSNGLVDLNNVSRCIPGLITRYKKTFAFPERKRTTNEKTKEIKKNVCIRMKKRKKMRLSTE